MAAPATVLKWSDLQTIFSGSDVSDGHDLLHSDDVYVFCFNCRKNGHTESHCSEPRRCFVCLKPTHQGYQCVDNPVQGSVVYKPNERCTACHERGHTAAFCKKPGGGMHARGGAKHLADTVFPRPLVLYVPRDSGPTDAEIKEARAAITEVLRHAKQLSHHCDHQQHPFPATNSTTTTTTTTAQDGNTANAGATSAATPTGPSPSFGSMVPSLHQMRDVEFFCAVLPLLNDPNAHLTPSERSAIKEGLFKMRSAVAGSISLGDTQKKGRAGALSSTSGRGAFAQHVPAPGDEGDLLYDMKTSGLDINVLYGGRLDVFHRTKHNNGRVAKGNVDGGGGGTGRVTSSGQHPAADALLHPETTVAQYVYLSQAVRKPTRSRNAAVSPRDGKDVPARAFAKGQEGNVEHRLNMLATSLEAIDNLGVGGIGGGKRVVQQPGPHRQTRSVVSASGGGAGGSASSTFVAPVPPHMRHHEAVSAQILAEWANDNAAPNTTTKDVPQPSPSRGGSNAAINHRSVHPPATSRGVVRSFISSAKPRSHATQHEWAKPPPPPARTARTSDRPSTTEGHSSSNSGNDDAPIMNWNVYQKQHLSTTMVHLFQPAPPPSDGNKHNTTPATSTTSDPTQPLHVVAARDVVQQWRSRFDRCKAVDAQRVGASLAQRAVHRHIVASNDHVFEQLASAFVSGRGRGHTGRGAASTASRSQATSSPSSDSESGEAQSPRANKPLLFNIWSARCQGLASSEAKARLRHEIVSELRAYARRIGLVVTPSGDPIASSVGNNGAAMATATCSAGAVSGGAADAFMDTLCTAVLEAPSKSVLIEKAKSTVVAYAQRVPRGAVLLKRVSRVALALFDEMEVAQTDTGVA